MSTSIVSRANFGDVEPKFVGTILAGITSRDRYESTEIVPGECVHVVLDDSFEDEDFGHMISILNRNLDLLGYLEPKVAEELAFPIDDGDLLVCGRVLTKSDPTCDKIQNGEFLDYVLLWVYELPIMYRAESWPADDEDEEEELPKEQVA